VWSTSADAGGSELEETGRDFSREAESEATNYNAFIFRFRPRRIDAARDKSRGFAKPQP